MTLTAIPPGQPSPSAGEGMSKPAMRPARDDRMRQLFLCPQGHILRKATASPPRFCEACHTGFDWSDLRTAIPVDECRQLFVEAES